MSLVSLAWPPAYTFQAFEAGSPIVLNAITAGMQ